MGHKGYRADKRASWSMLVLVQFVLFVMWISTASAALEPVSCDPKMGVTDFGLEWVADECVPFTMNDDSYIHYTNNYVTCNPVTKTVGLFAPYGDTATTPAAFLAYVQGQTASNGQPYRIFRNSEGTHFLLVHPLFTGEIDGKKMTDYTPGQVYTDVFSRGLILPQMPNCKGGEDNNPCNEINTGSSVNVGTGRLSQYQELFSLNNNRTLSLGVALHYRSMPFAPSSIGNGWSHNYEATLLPGEGLSMDFWIEGTRRIYNRSNSSANYKSPPGDHSTLTRNGNTWVITELDGLTRTFDESGKLSSVSDRYNNALTFTYSGSRLIRVTDVTGRSVNFGYQAVTGKLETVADPQQNVHTLGYTGGNLASYTPPGGQGQWLYTYGANGLLEVKTNPEQISIRYSYDSEKKLQKTTDFLNNEKTFSIASTPSLPSVCLPGGPGNPGKIPDPYNAHLAECPPQRFFGMIMLGQDGWRLGYDPFTMVVRSATDPYGKTTDYYYNRDATLRAMTVPFDDTTRLTTFYTNDANGNVLTETEPVNLATYTPAINPQTVDIASLATLTPPIKTAVSYTYDTAANFYQLKSITDHRGTSPLTTTFDRTSEPDGQGGNLLVTKRTAPGITAGSTLVSFLRQHSNGTIASYIDSANGTTQFTYYPIDAATKANGSAGLVNTVTFPDGVKLTITAYDKNGNIIAYKLTDANNVELPTRTVMNYDPLNRVTTLIKESTATPHRFPANQTIFGYDKNGNRNRFTDAENRTTTFKYTQKGQLTEITDARQGVTKLDYGTGACPSCTNGADRLTAVRDANHVANNLPGTTYTYDLVDRLVSETDPVGKKIRYTYFDSGLVREKIDATVPDAEKVLVTFSYDTNKRLTKKRYSDGTEATYSYDSQGRLQSASNQSIGYTFTYHTNGWLKTVTDSNGKVISYDDYTANGQKKQVTYFPTTPDQQQLIYGYDSASRIQTITSPAGTFTYGYDTLGRRSSLTYPNQIIATYGYDDLQRLTSLNHQYQATPIATYGYTHDQVGNRLTKSGTVNETYRYDELYRLQEADTAKGTEKYGYDPVGNRLTGPGPKDTKYQYDAANRMITGRLVSYLYDNMGNQTKRLTSNPAKNWVQTWDDENQLTKVEKGTGVDKQTVTFKYDPFGRRVEKKFTTQGKTTTWTYIYDGGDIAQEIETDGTTTTKTGYTHGANIDEHLALTRNNQTFYYHQDGLGSVTTITDANRAVVQRYSYESFGKLTQQTNFKNSYTYTGREYDPQTGLYYYRARYYDPLDGRFVSKDPISYAGGINVFAYVQNNPISRIDPTGLSDLLFDRGTGTLTAFDNQGNQVTQFPAGNNTTLTSKGPWPNGTYNFSHYNEHPESGPTGPYGSYGIFVFNVPGRTGMGVHSGRSGPKSKTLGCVRTTESAMDSLYDLHSIDPIKTITIR